MSDWFDSEEDKAEREALARDSAAIIDSLDNPWAAQKTLFYCILANLSIFAFGFFAAGWIYGLVLETQLLIFFALFIVGFLCSFSALRLYQTQFSKQSETSEISGEFMSHYAYQSYKQRIWIVWLVSVAAGVFNAVFFILFLTFVA
jgi:hypothetical protein